MQVTVKYVWGNYETGNFSTRVEKKRNDRSIAAQIFHNSEDWTSKLIALKPLYIKLFAGVRVTEDKLLFESDESLKQFLARIEACYHEYSSIFADETTGFQHRVLIQLLNKSEIMAKPVSRRAAAYR